MYFSSGCDVRISVVVVYRCVTPEFVETTFEQWYGFCSHNTWWQVVPLVGTSQGKWVYGVVVSWGVVESFWSWGGVRGLWLVVLLSARLMKLETSGSYVGVRILKSSIMSPCWRLYASVGRFRACKRSGYGRFFNEGTSLVARRCTFSIAVICFLGCGAHIWLAYSRWGRTRDLYRCTKFDWSKYSNVLLIIPTMEFDLFIFSLRWCSNVNCSSKVTPTSFSWLVCCSGPRRYVWWCSWCVDTCRCLHLSGWNFRSESLVQLCMASRSSCNFLKSSSLYTSMTRNFFLLSANRYTSDRLAPSPNCYAQGLVALNVSCNSICYFFSTQQFQLN